MHIHKCWWGGRSDLTWCPKSSRTCVGWSMMAHHKCTMYLHGGQKSCSRGHFLCKGHISFSAPIVKFKISDFCWTILLLLNFFQKGSYNTCFSSVYYKEGTVLGARNRVTYDLTLLTKNQVLNFIWGPASIKEGDSNSTKKILSFEGLVVLVGSLELHSGQENNKNDTNCCSWEGYCWKFRIWRRENVMHVGGAL